MPRPGPRPYECVRRAWHSDRHRPMRGSIIQQIFRVVHESHSPATRKNREWQEKLPKVVIRAEEIMYSKANSEAEYMDPDTLWDRINDAIDTIIRKEDGMESEGFLQPCIEAALVLGCFPVRASRSQRNINPRSYLSHRAQPSAQEASLASNKFINDERFLPESSVAPSNQLNIEQPVLGNNLNNISKLDDCLPRNSINITSCSYDNHPLSHPRLECDILQSLPVVSNHSVKLGSVYPLYYGFNCQPLESKTCLQQQSNPSNVIVGTPVAWSSVLPNNYGSTRDLFHQERPLNALDRPRQANLAEACESPSQTECDLSLRLGLPLDFIMGQLKSP